VLALNLRSEDSTESRSDRVSIHVNIAIGQDCNPVATALGTDSMNAS